MASLARVIACTVHSRSRSLTSPTFPPAMLPLLCSPQPHAGCSAPVFHAPSILDFSNVFQGLVKAPNLAPFDGEGESISGPPQPTFRPQRKVKLASAGRHHSVVVAECRGGGFKDDGSCNCKYGWKGPDCNIQCNGGANFSCSGHGTFDQSNKRGDRKTCAAYLESLWRSKKDDNGGKCVGLKAPGRSDAAGCPGDNNNQGCP